MDSSIIILLAGLAVLILIGVAVARLLRPTPSPKPVTPFHRADHAIPTPRSGSLEQQARSSALPGRPAYVLTAVAGSRAGVRFELPPAGLKIGRGPENDIVLQEPMVSRQHAEIIAREGGWVALDRNSINGTFVNEQRVFDRALESGNRLQIGVSEFVFHRSDAPVPHTPAGPPQPIAQPVARSFDSYQIEGLIGDGGMAVVYRARTHDGRVVAIKIPKIAGDSYLMRKFEKEGSHIGAQLRGHPNIVQIDCFGYQRDGTPYIVMEYVDGGSLRERLRQPLPPDEVRRMVGETCLALGFAHQRGLVHRDIKPENILLTRQGVVKVADFGIAKDLAGNTVTHKGPIGTPEYMSPEQAKGEDTEPASDIYAVGVVLYEMLTGQVPFPRRAGIDDEVRQAIDVVERHIQEPPRPPDQIRPGIPRDLAAFAVKALNKDPRKRYADGREAAAALGFKDRPEAQLAAPRPSTARLVVAQGPQRGKVIPLALDVVTIGRADVDPTSAQISRRHAVLRRRGSDFYLSDVSMNGTWINNTRVSGEPLVVAGDHIRMGESVLRLEI